MIEYSEGISKKHYEIRDKIAEDRIKTWLTR